MDLYFAEEQGPAGRHTFEKPNYRAVLLRSIAWVGKRANPDKFCSKEELEALRNPQGKLARPQ